MTYDAVLVARRGLGPTELRLASPTFMAAIRWALFAEKAGAGLTETRTIAASEVPDAIVGADRIAFMANRRTIREGLADLEGKLYPEDDDG